MENGINKLKGYRIMIGMSQTEMADAIGMSLRTYQDKESGKSDLKLKEATAIIEVLKVKGLDVKIEELN